MGDRRLLRVVIGAQALSFAVVGVWAQLGPRSFYDDFPGAGRHWVAADGPYNEHLVRDVGGLNLGLALLSAVAAATLGRTLIQAAAAAALLYGVPHVVYHLFHLDLYDAGDAIASIAALTLNVLAPAAALALTRRRPTG